MFRTKKKRYSTCRELRKKLLYLEHDDTSWVYDVYDHFCSIQHSVYPLYFLLKEALWQTVKAAMNCSKQNATFHQGLRTFQGKAFHFGNKHNLKGLRPKNANCLFCLLEHFRNLFCKQLRLSLIWVNTVCCSTDSKTI